MNADTKTLLKLFGADVRYEVPMFQRPYVWEQDKQWEPLWTDLVSACRGAARTALFVLRFW